MPYNFGADEPVTEAFARCAREQLDHAIDELSGGIQDDPARAVHSARKSIKKERSLLRLALGAVPSDQRRLANSALREAARELASARDAEVMTATVEQLSDRFAGQLPATTFDTIRAHLGSRGNGKPEAVVGESSRAEALETLRAVRLQVGGWELAEGGWKAIGSGLTRSYERGRRAFGRARASRASEDLHDLRKRVKDLWYQERLLAPAAGPTVRSHAKDAHRLADLLGDDHDLSLLRDELIRSSTLLPVDLDATLALIDHRRDELQTEAIHIGARIYAESPKAFRRRMRRSFTIGRADATAPLERRPAELAAATRTPNHDG